MGDFAVTRAEQIHHCLGSKARIGIVMHQRQQTVMMCACGVIGWWQQLSG